MANRNNMKRGKKAPFCQTCAVPDNCVELASTYLGMQKDKVTNYLKQESRIRKQAQIARKKLDKKDVFKAVLVRLTEAGGGNRSALQCSNFEQGTQLMTSISANLSNCSVNIQERKL